MAVPGHHQRPKHLLDQPDGLLATDCFSSFFDISSVTALIHGSDGSSVCGSNAVSASRPILLCCCLIGDLTNGMPSISDSRDAEVGDLGLSTG